jgi:hypothetical protein
MSRSKRSPSWALAGAALAATWLATPPASAQFGHIPDNNWRQTDRHDAHGDGGPPPKGYFELRFGPYLPTDIDSADPGLARHRVAATPGLERLRDAARPTPFASVFGLRCDKGQVVGTGPVSHRLYVGVEADYLPLHIPYVGGLGVGLGWGFTRFSNQARFTRDLTRCSEETTSLTLMPMHASLVLRVDELLRRTRVPVVPYGKLGAGLTWWRMADDGGTETICGTPEAPAPCNRPSDVPVAHGHGLLPTLHLAVGMMLSLSFLDADSTAMLRESVGVGHLYAFGEVSSDSLSLAANVLHVGVTSWVAGLAFDL